MKKMTKKPTFLIQMLDNQNMTWQGTITFLDTNQKLPFRSLLELLKLMDSAMGSSEFSQDLSNVPSSEDEEEERSLS